MLAMGLRLQPLARCGRCVTKGRQIETDCAHFLEPDFFRHAGHDGRANQSNALGIGMAERINMLLQTLKLSILKLWNSLVFLVQNWPVAHTNSAQPAI